MQRGEGEREHRFLPSRTTVPQAAPRLASGAAQAEAVRNSRLRGRFLRFLAAFVLVVLVDSCALLLRRSLIHSCWPAVGRAGSGAEQLTRTPDRSELPP